ncbi:hypothetical protein [Streptomyces anulatus]|uniref:hypothetical protein n=1 Tax=Streptomyces anulatus TaxID=1892 RepID=UPI003331B2DF
MTTLYSKLTAEDLALGDVDALVGYLIARLEKGREGASYGSDAFHALSTVESLLKSQADDTRAVFAASPVTEELLSARLRQWNKLIRVVRAWRGEADFSDRWNLIEHRNAAAAAEAATRRLSRL